MADDADRAEQDQEILLADLIRRATRVMDPGAPGDCDLCGEHSMRLVRGVCAPCRDRFKLP